MKVYKIISFLVFFLWAAGAISQEVNFDGSKYNRLTNSWMGEARSLDVNPEGLTLVMAPTGNYSGQFWKITDTSAPSGPVKNEPVKVGDKAHGGIVFYVDKTGLHGLVCQEKDFDKMMTFQEAQAACKNSSAGGKNDWRLPDLNELKLMYENLRKSGLTHFDNEWYWSSKVENEHNMWGMDILHGRSFAHWEGDHSHVRAVRAF